MAYSKAKLIRMAISVSHHTEYEMHTQMFTYVDFSIKFVQFLNTVHIYSKVKHLTYWLVLSTINVTHYFILLHFNKQQTHHTQFICFEVLVLHKLFKVGSPWQVICISSFLLCVQWGVAST